MFVIHGDNWKEILLTCKSLLTVSWSFFTSCETAKHEEINQIDFVLGFFEQALNNMLIDDRNYEMMDDSMLRALLVKRCGES